MHAGVKASLSIHHYQHTHFERQMKKAQWNHLICCLSRLLAAPELNLLRSEMSMGGICLDQGHDMTQIHLRQRGRSKCGSGSRLCSFKDERGMVFNTSEEFCWCSYVRSLFKKINTFFMPSKFQAAENFLLWWEAFKTKTCGLICLL